MISRSRLRPRALAAILAFSAPALALTTSANTVFAQTAPQVTSKTSETEVEVGEAFTVELSVMSETDEALSAPELRVPQGFSVSGPMIAQQSYFQFGTGGRKAYRGVSATWSLVASTPGSFNIPAPSITWNAQKLRGTPSTIKVLPQGSRPQRQQGGFLFPGGAPPGFGPNWPFGTGGFEPDEDVDQPGDDPALNLPRAPNEDVFLHATVDKKAAVVGEQVTVGVYLYTRVSLSQGGRGTTRMPLQDFLSMSLTKDQGATQTTQSARAGNRRYQVRLLDKFALFPLRTGKLHTGAWKETFYGQDRRRLLERASEDITVDVAEPPLANRPVGFRVGDVGQFQISALVQPRRVDQGGSVAVSVRVVGAGNFPTNLPVPEKTGVEWLDPEKKDNIEPRNGEIAGSRSFGYVVRLTRTGTVDLGNIEFPYWNPRARRYEVARTVLGAVEVTPVAGAKATPAPSASAEAAGDDPFKNLPPPRTALSAFVRPPEGTLLLEGPLFVGALVAPPFLALAGIAGVELARRTRARLATRKSSPRTLANAALDDARRAKKSGDERAAAAAIERAIVLAIEGATGLKARGVLKASLASELAANGVPEAVAKRASEALATCDNARFDPLAAADVKVEDAEKLVADLLATKAP